MAAQAVPIFAAVDVLGDDAVRLEQGDFARVSVRAGDPLALVRRFAAAGAGWIHLVDLVGARAGRVRPGLVAAAAAAAGAARVQASGGVRSVADVEELIDAGAARVVIGTAAFATGELPRFAETFGERLVVAVDVRDGCVAVAGWTETLALAPEEAARRCAAAGVPR